MNVVLGMFSFVFFKYGIKDLRIIICFRKSEVIVERVLACSVI